MNICTVRAEWWINNNFEIYMHENKLFFFKKNWILKSSEVLKCLAKWKGAMIQ